MRAFLLAVLLPGTISGPDASALRKARLPALPDGYWPRLEAGEVVVMEEERDDSEDRSYGDIVELALIEAAPEEVFGHIADGARWPEWFPDIRKTRLLDEMGDAEAIRARLWEYEASVSLFTFGWQGIVQEDRASGVVEWTLNPEHKGDLKMSEGHWWLYPIDGNRKTLVVYAVKLESRMPLPRFIETAIAEGTIRDALTNLRWRALSGGRWKKGDPPPPSNGP